MSLIGEIALTGVGAQLILTIIFQFAPFKSRFHRLDYIGILPRWQFFVRRGGNLDHALAIRGRSVDGTSGDWRTIWEMPQRRPWNWLWSPDPDDDHTMWFAIATLERRIGNGRDATPGTSFAYAMILDECRRRTHQDPAFAACQFALVQIGADGDRRIGFTSPFHGPFDAS